MLTIEKFQSLQYVEDLIAYDGASRVFKTGIELFVSYAAQRNSDMYLLVSRENIDLLKSDTIDIRTFFERSFEYYLVEFTDKGPQITQSTMQELDQEQFIPEYGVFLNFEEN